MKVRDAMTTPVVTARADTPFPDLVGCLLDNEISGVPVVDDEDHVLGIVTEADLVSKKAYGGHRRRALELLADLVSGGETGWVVKGKGRTAVQVMSTPVETVAASDDLRTAARHMLERKVKRLPVVDDGRLVGMVSRTDLLRSLHRADDELASDVAGMLADPLRAPDDHQVTATVEDGVVILGGSTRQPIDLPLLAAMVWRLPGVVDVRNEATAREGDPTRDGRSRGQGSLAG